VKKMVVELDSLDVEASLSVGGEVLDLDDQHTVRIAIAREIVPNSRLRRR
jgi:hypothetical protein